MGFLSNIFKKKQEEVSNLDLAFYIKVVDQLVVSETLKNSLKDDLNQAFIEPLAF